MIETSSLSFVETKPLLGDEVPQALIDDANLSELQLEALAYAEFRFNQPFTPSGQRKALLLADSTGSGKGRMQSGVMVQTTMKHPSITKHVWVSLNTGLAADSQRDLVAVRAKHHAGLVLKTTEGVGYNQSLPNFATPTVLYTTYAWLRGKEPKKKGKKRSNKFSTRIDQLIDWLGGADFEGVLSLDEVHACKA